MYKSKMMARREQNQMSTDERRLRNFSTSFKTQKVREIEHGKTRFSEICKQYKVSTTSVYRWIDKYGTMKKAKVRIIVEAESDTKQLLELKKKAAELERTVGQKQILLYFKDKMIEIAEEMYVVDIKKSVLPNPRLLLE